MSLIEVDHVVKRFRLGASQDLTHGVKRVLAKVGIGNEPPRPRLNALEDVSFSVEPGEVLGIIGTNGAGKSTMLKVLAGITSPTMGRVTVRGRTAPLIEVGAGLIADLTGRENIYLNGVILGMSLKDIRRKFDEIVQFAELEKFIDTPIKRYSSGMSIRLGFSIATAVESDILIVDEVLAVGDIAFQRKCFDRIEDIIRKQRKTILLVSHNIRQVERLCTRALLLDHGRILSDGNPHDVSRQFYERTNAKIKADTTAMQEVRQRNSPAAPASVIEIVSIHPIDERGAPSDAVVYRRDLRVEIVFRAVRDLRELTFGMGIHTSDMLYLATHNSDFQLKVAHLSAGDYRIVCNLRRPPLVPGVYSLRLGIFEGSAGAPAFYGENLAHILVTAIGADEQPPSSPDGFFALDGVWEEPQAVETPVGRAGVPVRATALV